VQLLQLIIDQAPGSVVGDGMLVDGAPAHTPAAAAATAPGAKPSTASEGLLARLAASGGALKADDIITFSVWMMLNESAHSLPGSLAALKPIMGMLVVEGTLCHGSMHTHDIYTCACSSACGRRGPCGPASKINACMDQIPGVSDKMTRRNDNSVNCRLLIKYAPGIACFNGVLNRASASPA
jgi:hypothetical protein